MSVPGVFARYVAEATTTREPTGSQRIARVLLAAGAVAYGAAVRLRNIAYDVGVCGCHRLACRVLCVGNLTTGGTGKTPTVILMARRLQAMGERPAVLLRGYGRTGTAPAVVADGARTLLGWRDGGDEAVLLAQALPGIPIMVGADRVAAGTAAIAAFQPTILLLDDGFQHRRLHRDADLVLLDGTDPLGGGWMLPRGRLREPADSLARAHGLLVTRSDQIEDREQLRRRLAALAPGCPIGWAAHRPSGLIDPATGDRLPVSGLRDRPVHLLSGIANPGAFEATARSAGAAIVGASIYPDHHPFTPRDCEGVAAAARRAGAACLLTTTKDAVRLAEHLPLPIPVLALEIEIRLLAGAEGLGQAVGVSLEGEGRG